MVSGQRGLILSEFFNWFNPLFVQLFGFGRADSPYFWELPHGYDFFWLIKFLKFTKFTRCNELFDFFVYFRPNSRNFIDVLLSFDLFFPSFYNWCSFSVSDSAADVSLIGVNLLKSQEFFFDEFIHGNFVVRFAFLTEKLVFVEF